MGQSPEFNILLHTFVITEIIFLPLDFNNSPVILSTPGDLPLFSDCIADIICIINYINKIMEKLFINLFFYK